MNLPTEWNQKAAQLGGSGLNGSIPAALNTHFNAPESQPAGVGAPIARGYMEMGSYSGHTNSSPNWTTNKEAYTNLAHTQMKKTRDVAVDLAKTYYGSVPKLVYYLGSSQGGREALIVSQKYPNDYDGIFSQVPIVGFTGITVHPTLLAQEQTGAGWIPPAKVSVIANEVLRQCDALDGLADGVVSNYEKCNAMITDLASTNTVPWARIRCASGNDEGDTCLSDAQIATLNAMHSTFDFAGPLAFGAPGWAGWSVGGELRAWINERTQPTSTYAGSLGGSWWKGVITGDANFAALTFDPSNWRPQILEASRISDATDPDISAYCNRGGKLIMKHHPGGDYTANARELIRYYKQMEGVIGKDKQASCTRLYMAPGQGHSMSNNPTQRGSYGDTVIPSQIDMLDILDKWVAGKTAPNDTLMLEQRDLIAPFAVTATRPICRYPAYPKFKGGTVTDGGNYMCTTD